ncbi:MAG: cytochrome c [Acidobacteriia bacterium]|nr:cytochrome c [Terriglobia bacterium]
MLFKVLLFAAILGSGLFVLGGQQPVQTGVFTAAQAEAGRRSYENTCGRCHTYTLMGRKGAEGELPPVSSLSEADQKFIGNPNRVPPLAGEAFLNRWGMKTVAQLIDRFQITVSDPNFKFKDIDDDTTVNITAYVLQVNGAKAGTQPLTRSTRDIVNSLVK